MLMAVTDAETPGEAMVGLTKVAYHFLKTGKFPLPSDVPDMEIPPPSKFISTKLW